MSNSRPDSERSRFNGGIPPAPIQVSANFAQVVRQALALGPDSGGEDFQLVASSRFPAFAAGAVFSVARAKGRLLFR